jgi:hypothetical protein
VFAVKAAVAVAVAAVVETFLILLLSQQFGFYITKGWCGFHLLKISQSNNYRSCLSYIIWFFFCNYERTTALASQEMHVLSGTVCVFSVQNLGVMNSRLHSKKQRKGLED